MADYSIEIQRNNVTLAQFLRYARKQCEKKGFSMDIDREEFENPYRPESYSYTVVNGEKKCHSAEYITSKHLRRKLAEYHTPDGFTRYYYSDELEEYANLPLTTRKPAMAITFKPTATQKITDRKRRQPLQYPTAGAFPI